MQYPKGHEFEMKSLKPSQILTDPLYQRDLSQSRVIRIAKEFNGDTVNEPKVSFRDGKYWVWDGQHTIAAWKQIHKGADKPILCKIYHGMTWIEEAECFIRQNGISKDPTTNERLRAEFNSGNRDVKDMVEAANFCGITVDFKNSRAIGKVVATSTLYKSYKTLSRPVFCEMLQCIMDVWGGDSDSLTSQILTGMTQVFKLYYGEFEVKELTKSLKNVSPNMIIREGKEMAGSSGKNYGRVILRYYNKKRTSKRLEDKM